MQYLMKQKLFSLLADDFIIKDEAERDVFIVAGKGFSNDLHFNDLSGKEIASIVEDTVPWESTFNIYKGEALWAVVQKKLFTLFKSKFAIDVFGQEAILAEGDFSDHEYVFTRAGKPIAHVSKEWFTFVDTYGVDVDQQDDAVLILASTVIIDMCETD
ncbi:MAG TPA: LURP-one-related family protein [Candidatus Angelobacter sp.]